jgi:polyketide biosynthesis malonyl-CoA-[acyl-carrier-protein] transacylase
MGEYNALLAAGAIDFATGLKLVQKRGELMSQARSGGMAAILGFSEEKISEILMRHGLNIDIANLNSPSQIVVSGVKTDILNAQSIFENSGATYIPLNVSGAFHSRLMDDVKEIFSRYLQNFNFSPPEIPVISNVLAKPYSGHNIQQLLADQITHPVKWTDSVRYLLDNGVKEFIETGPGDLLSKLIDSIKRHTLSEV